VLLSIRVPADNERGPSYVEQALAAIHQANVDRLPLDFAYGSHAGTVTLVCRCPPLLSGVVRSQLAAHYPAATIDVLSDDAFAPPAGSSPWSLDLRLRPDLFPIRRHGQFDDPLRRALADPLTAVFAALAAAHDAGLIAPVRLTAAPARPRSVRHARTAMRHLSHPLLRAHPTLARLYARLATSHRSPVRLCAAAAGVLFLPPHAPVAFPISSTRTHEREDDVQAATDKLGRHLLAARLRIIVFAPRGAAERARVHLRSLAGAFGQFTVPRLAVFECSRIRRRASPRRSPSFLLSCEEVATLWHPATAAVQTPAMAVTECRQLEPPVSLPSPASAGATLLGRVRFRGRRDLVGFLPDDRRRHLAVIGKTGMGKTTLLQRLIATDIERGEGVALLDPHGDLAEHLLSLIPRHRTNDVIVFDAGDAAFPPAFNPLAYGHGAHRSLVASGVLSAFKKLYGDSWGPRLEHILRNALLAVLEMPERSLMSVHRLVSDAPYRRAVTDRTRDPLVRAFWQREFASWKPQFQAEAVAPVQNKLGQFLSHPILRAIVGQRRAHLDLRRAMDGGHILLANLSKGRIGDDGATLLGSLLVTGIQLAAMSRADVAEGDRRDFHLYVDEFQNFATESFATILSEARKYRLTLTVANQYVAQMSEATAAALFGNVGSLIAFQVGATDAEALALQLGADVLPRDLQALPRYTAYARLLLSGMPSRPFSIETLKPPSPGGLHAFPEIVRRTSRHRYARPAGAVEADLHSSLSPLP